MLVATIKNILSFLDREWVEFDLVDDRLLLCACDELFQMSAVVDFALNATDAPRKDLTCV